MLLSRHLLRPTRVLRLRTATIMAVAPSSSQAGLSKTSAARPFMTTEAGAGFEHRSLSIRECDDDPGIRQRYRPFLLDKEGDKADWVDDLELGTVMTMAAENMQRTGDRLKVLVLFGSLRQRWANRRVIGSDLCPEVR